MRKLHWPIPVVGVFVAALATAQEPASKPPENQGTPHGMMRDGGPMRDMSAMMEMMRSMTPEQRAKMVEHCRQMMEAAAATTSQTEK
jgi:hypothetical protein